MKVANFTNGSDPPILKSLAGAAPWTQAMQLAEKAQMKLPSNIQFNFIYPEVKSGLNGAPRNSTNRQTLRNCMPCWTENIVAFNQLGGQFRKGFDVRDSNSTVYPREWEDFEVQVYPREWVIPSSYLEKASLTGDPYAKNAILYITPGLVEDQPNRVVIHPKTIVVAPPSLSYMVYGPGLFYICTSFPLNAVEIDPNLTATLPLLRYNEAAIRPVQRSETFTIFSWEENGGVSQHHVGVDALFCLNHGDATAGAFGIPLSEPIIVN